VAETGNFGVLAHAIFRTDTPVFETGKETQFEDRPAFEFRYRVVAVASDYGSKSTSRRPQ
jgi:hypothetical protein